MGKLISLVALVLALLAPAQPAQGANTRAEENTQGANQNAEAMDAATRARVRGEGLAGGTGARVPPEANGGATVGDGKTNRHFVPGPAQRDEPPEEQSSDRDAKSGSGQKTQAAIPNASTLDPATQARVRLEGVAGGTGARVPPEAGGATVGEGQTNRH
jgi:type II secretory pathway pseudopilin PulG